MTSWPSAPLIRAPRNGQALAGAGVSWLAGPPRPAGARTRFGEVAWFREGLYQVAPHCYAWMVPNGSWGETNIGLIEGHGHSVLVDTCWDLRYTQEMLTAAQPIVERSPIEVVINTHADGDHCWGNQLFADRTIVATQACAHQMHHMQPRSLQALKSAGRLLRYLPVGGLHRFGHYMANMFSPYDFSGVSITQPQETFSGEKHLKVGGVDLVIAEVGPAHTDSDALVFVPERRVVYAADILFVGVTPVMWAGPVQRLINALQYLLTLEADIIVPGHGPLASRADVQAAIDYWDFAQTALNRGFQRGLTPLQAANAVLASTDFQSSVFAHWDSPERMLTNAYTLYRHWGAPLPSLPGKLGIMNIMREQASLAFAMGDAAPRVMHRY